MRTEYKVDVQHEYDDVLIEPILSSVNSREDVSTKSSIWLANGVKLELDVPIIASPMKGIVGTDLIIELGKLGGIGILHRFYKDAFTHDMDISHLEDSGVPYGLAVGLDTYDGNIIIDRIIKGDIRNCKILCIDVANGYTEKLRNYTRYVSRLLSKRPVAIMSGNVANYSGYKALIDSGANLVRVGIGSGQLCTTRNKTGIGYPQVSALLDIQAHYSGNALGIVADGGIKSTGDIVKALACGSDLVMIGSMFAKAFESDNNGVIYGMASQQLQDEFYGKVKSVEGISKIESKELPLEAIVDDIVWSIKSAGTYLDSRNLREIRKNAQFIVVGNNSIVEK